MQNFDGYINNFRTEVFDAAPNQTPFTRRVSNRSIRASRLFIPCLVWNELGSVTVGPLTKTQSFRVRL